MKTTRTSGKHILEFYSPRTETNYILWEVEFGDGINKVYEFWTVKLGFEVQIFEMWNKGFALKMMNHIAEIFEGDKKL
jgi:hypothetical protein